MTASYTYAHRASFAFTSVLAAYVLSDECDADEPVSLREEASQDGLCYLRILRQIDTGVYVAHVAASPELVCSHPFTVLLTEDHLRFALPWDIRLQEKRLADGRLDAHAILRLLHAHAAASRPPVHHQPVPVFGERMSDRQSGETSPAAVDETLLPLPPVFVSRHHLEKVLHTVPSLDALSQPRGLWRRLHSWLTTALLQAALKATARCRVLHDALRHALEHHLSSSQRVVSVSEVYDDRRHVGWWLIVGVQGAWAA